MEFKYDQEADAIYFYFNSKPYAYGKELDDERRIDFSHDNIPIGVELLCISKGVNLGGLPYADEIALILKANGIMIYTLEPRYIQTTQGYSDMVFSVELSSPRETQAKKYTATLPEEVTV